MIKSVIKLFALYSATQASLIPTRTSRTDPCVAVCEEFSSSQRGNGVDMCESPDLSQCVYESRESQYFCTNLYWALTEDGQRGLTYSANLVDLSPAERSNPLTCLEAVHLMGGVRDVSTISPGETHYWTPTATPPTPFFLAQNGLEAMRMHAIAAGWPTVWDQPAHRRGPVSTGNPADWAPLLLSTTTTTTTPSGMRRVVNTPGVPADYFRMYRTTPPSPRVL